MARLSNVWVVSTIARGYLEVMRNTPLLLQLLFWYSLSQALPGPREALNPLPGVFLCFRGLFFPSLIWHAGYPWIAVERPVLVGFGFQGGASVSPEFAALLVGLTTYTAALIGEIVRGGILAVDKGQSEAAAALGLSRAKILRLVVLPQALRVIIPPTTSQFLNLLKNSSLAVAIGYPDLISITNTTLNQTGQAIEAIALAMAAYLVVSLGVSLAMNVYNAAIAPARRPRRMTAIARLTASIRRAPMFRDRTNAIATAVMGAAIAYAGFRFVEWAMVNAIWSLPPDAGSQACRAVRAEGACWAVIAERWRFMLFGGYPFAEQWRPAVACVLFVVLYGASTVRTWWNWRLLGLWIVLPAAAVALLRGGRSDSRTFRANSGEACR